MPDLSVDLYEDNGGFLYLHLDGHHLAYVMTHPQPGLAYADAAELAEAEGAPGWDVETMSKSELDDRRLDHTVGLVATWEGQRAELCNSHEYIYGSNPGHGALSYLGLDSAEGLSVVEATQMLGYHNPSQVKRLAKAGVIRVLTRPRPGWGYLLDPVSVKNLAYLRSQQRERRAQTSR